MRSRLLLGLMVGIVVLPLIAHGDAALSLRFYPTLYSNMGRDDLERSLGQAWTERMVLESELIKQLRSGAGNTQPTLAAIYLSGVYRLEGTVPDLLNLIDVYGNAPRPLKGAKPLWGEYPAAEALVKIGNRSSGAIMELLASDDDAKKRELALRVLIQTDGEEDIVTCRIKAALSKETDTQRKDRLKLAIRHIGDAR